MVSLDDDLPSRKLKHEIGQDLRLLSVEELSARIHNLHAEIARLEKDIEKKRASKKVADALFKI